MKQERALKLSYAAGFVDGEGCIRISKRNPRNGRSTSYNLLVMVTQKDGEIMDWFYGNFGGMVYLKNKDTYGSDWIYEWRLNELQAYKFLKELLPFLRYKRKQAELAIQFQERRIFGRKKTLDDRQRFTSLTEHELEEREKIYQEMSRLKKVFIKSKNPNVVEYTFNSMVQE